MNFRVWEWISEANVFVGGDLIYGVGWIDKVGIRCVARQDEEIVSWRRGFAAIAQWYEGITARLGLRGSPGGIRG